MDNKISLIYSNEYLKHDTGAGHPESPARLKSIISYLKSNDLINSLEITEPESAPLEWVKENHSEKYIDLFKSYCDKSMTFLLTSDNPICRESYRIALLAVGGILKAVDNVMENKFSKAFCLLRPPGHHALKNEAMGFCFFNNVAIAAKYLVKKYGLERILVVDWDVHHGNGTQDAFYEDNKVFFFSIHQHPLYPGSGMEWETGKGKGKGFTMNAPVPPGSSDDLYIEIFTEKLFTRAIDYNPQFILISSGFDAHKYDPLAQIQLSEAVYKTLTDIVIKMADKCCGGKIVSTLEGGYNLKYLPLCAAEHLKSLLGFK